MDLKQVFGQEDFNNPAVKSKRSVGVKFIALITAICIFMLGVFFAVGVVVGANTGMKNDMPLMQEAYELMKKYYYKDISWEEFQKIAAGAFAGSLDNFSGILEAEDGDGVSAAAFGFSIFSTIYNEHIISFIEPESPAWNTVAQFKFVESGGGELPTLDENFNPSLANEIYIEEGDKIYGIILEGSLYRVENAPAQLLRQLVAEHDDAIVLIKKYIGNSKYEDGYYGFYIEKAKLLDKTAYYYNYADDVGIIKVLEFSEYTTLEFAECVDKFIEDGNKKLILDLRNNGGGNSTTLEYMAQFLLDNPKDEELPLIKLVSNAGNGKMKSEIVYSSKYDYANPENTKSAFPIGNRVNGFEVVVLCNERSASASEALIGALQYYNNTQIVGVNTYGKGVAQKVFILSTGDYLYVTNGTYYVPTADENGNMVWDKCIHGEGFAPSEENVVTERLVSYSKDACVRRAMEIFGY